MDELALKKYIQQEIQAHLRGYFDERVATLESRVFALEGKHRAEPQSFRECCSFGVRGPAALVNRESRSYSPLKEMSDESELVATKDDEQMEPSYNGRPESMYNYCMERLAASSQPLRDPALLWWFLLFVVQFITIAAFSVYNDAANNEIGTSPPATRQKAISNCLFSGSSIAGVPLMQYCIGYVAIVLVASVTRDDDEVSLRATLPTQTGFIGWLSTFARFWQTVFMPACFALEAATVFATSPDAMAVVVNTLSVTFILEIDNMLFAHLLSEEDKQAYQKRVGLGHEDDKAFAVSCSWAMFVLNVVLMPTMFTMLVVTLGQENLYGEAYLDWYWWRVPFLYAFNFVGRDYAQRYYSLAEHSVCSNIPFALIGGVLGVLTYVVMVALASFKPELLLMPFMHYQESDFGGCQN